MSRLITELEWACQEKSRNADPVSESKVIHDHGNKKGKRMIEGNYSGHTYHELNGSGGIV